MKTFITSILIAVFSQVVHAIDYWHFEDRVAVTGEAKEGIFHHLDGAGRKHIATTENQIAVVWEDDHTSSPQIYLSIKSDDNTNFSTPIQLSDGEEAYEPTLIHLSDDRFVSAWEQDGRIKATSIVDQTIKHTIELSKSGSHVSVSAYADDIYLVWREQKNRKWSVWVAKLNLSDDGQLSTQTKNRVESKDLNHPVMFPTIGVNVEGVYVAWEDRESGNTRMKYSFSEDHAETFSEPEYLNEFFSNRNEYDKGNGSTRVTMSAISEDEIIATWMDKRRGGGYGIYASLGGGGSFGPNEKVQSIPGKTIAHYNPATASNLEGDFVIAWNDHRSGRSKLWLSSYNDDDEWSEDFAPFANVETGEQSHVSAAIDEDGQLHLFWVERETDRGPTRLWYSLGTILDN